MVLKSKRQATTKTKQRDDNQSNRASEVYYPAREMPVSDQELRVTNHNAAKNPTKTLKDFIP